MAHQNEEVIRSYIAALGAGDMDGVRSHLADGAVLHLGGRNRMSGDKRGVDEVVAALSAMSERAGGVIHPQLHDLLATDDHVVALVRRTIGGVDAVAAVVYHVSDGRITEIWPHEWSQYEIDDVIGSG